MLQCVAARVASRVANTLEGTQDVVCCIALRCITVCCSVLQCVAARVASRVANTLEGTQRCSVLQCVAVCCAVLQYVAACCRVLQRVLRRVLQIL